MLDTLRRHSVLRIPILGASLVFVLLRVIATVARADNPLGIVLLMSVLGAIELRFRGQHVLWANLGYDRWLYPAIYGSVAVIGETVIAMLAKVA